MAIIGKINDEVLIDDGVLRKPEILTRWIDPTLEEKDQEIERLNNIINTANKCILEFIQTEEYNKVDGLAIANNYMKLMQVLGTPTTYKELKEGK